MKPDTHDRDKERAALEHRLRQAQAQDDLQAAKDRDFYARLGLDSPDSQPPEDTFVISIHSEHWTREALEAGEPHARNTELERVTVDAEELARYGRDYGISEPSSTDPAMTSHLWFRSTYPREDRAYFEQGVEKYYSLHVHEVNGHSPGPEDFQRVANLIDVRFDYEIPLPNREEQEGPDLCL